MDRDAFKAMLRGTTAWDSHHRELVDRLRFEYNPEKIRAIQAECALFGHVPQYEMIDADVLHKKCMVCGAEL